MRPRSHRPSQRRKCVMSDEVCSIHLSELLGKLLAVHRADEAAFDQLSDEQVEELAGRSSAESFFKADAWDFAASEIWKRSGIARAALAEFTRRVALRVLDGV